MNDNEKVLIQAEFNPIVRAYILLYIFGIMAVTVVGIPLAVIWICGLGQWYSRHFYDKLFCVLTEKHIRFRMGVLFTVDKTIPLENIQDLTFYEGPVLRHFNLAMLKVETAGQGHHSGNEMKLVGIVDAHLFRKRVLEQREAVKLKLSANASGDDKHIMLLEKMAASLENIEKNLGK